jgi:chorismate-pyruvate lyase
MIRQAVEELFRLFPSEGAPAFDEIAGHEVPEPYHGLLVHRHHMTVTVEAYHGGPVDVRVLEKRLDGRWYSRRILLTSRSTGFVAQFGIVRIDLSRLSEPARQAILEEKTPVGRVLIDHQVLREVEPLGFLRFPAARWFAGQQSYGRLAIIHCDGEPAVQALEIVAP